MGWLQLVGSLKLHVSFAEYSLFYRALLQQRPMILRSLLVVATAYHVIHEWITPHIWMRDVTHTHKHTEDLPKWREIVASPFSYVCVTHKIVCVCVTRRILRAIMCDFETTSKKNQQTVRELVLSPLFGGSFVCVWHDAFICAIMCDFRYRIQKELATWVWVGCIPLFGRLRVHVWHDACVCAKYDTLHVQFRKNLKIIINMVMSWLHPPFCWILWVVVTWRIYKWFREKI